MRFPTPSKTVLRAAAFLAFPLVFLAVSEWIAGDGAGDVFHVFAHDVRVGVFSYLWILAAQALLWGIFGRYAFGVFAFLSGLIAFIHVQKVATLGEPLYPTDVFAHAGEVGNLAAFADVLGQAATYEALAVVLAIGLAGFWIFRGAGPSLRQRIAAAGTFGALQLILVSNAFGSLSEAQRLTGLTPENYAWRQAESYRDNGFWGGFFVNLGSIHVKKPEGYSDDTAAALREAFSGSVPSGSGSPVFSISATDPKKKPNVIVILSESFWDVPQLPNVKFDPDPIPNYRAIMAETGGGRTVSPTFGGKTAIVEFEVLTGNSMAFLPIGSIPYQQYVTAPVAALPWEFKKNGYDTVAVHTYEKTFFNRVNAYPKLGFDRFVSEEDMEDPEYKGPFISDEAFVDQILKQLKDPARKNPLFAFGISMENHFSYDGHKFDGFDISVSGSGLTADDTQTVRNYAQGIRDADRAIGRLVAELREYKEPTYVLVFGDHLGILRENFGAYVHSGFLHSADEAQWTDAERLSMYAPPFFVWNNFGTIDPAAALPRRDFGYVRAPFLGNLVLDQLGDTRKDPQFNFLSRVSSCFRPAADFDMALSGGSGTTADGGSCAGVRNEYDTLEYSSLFGSRK